MKTSCPLGRVRAYFVVWMSVYMSVRMCRCPYADSASLREYLSHASTYLEFPQQALTGLAESERVQKGPGLYGLVVQENVRTPI